MNRVTEKEPIKQTVAELIARLAEARTKLFPDLEIRVEEIRDIVKQANDALLRLEEELSHKKQKEWSRRTTEEVLFTAEQLVDLMVTGEIRLHISEIRFSCVVDRCLLMLRDLENIKAQFKAPGSKK